jgi:hypothetical protein
LLPVILAQLHSVLEGVSPSPDGLAAPLPLCWRFAEAKTTQGALRTRKAAVPWNDGLLRYANNDGGPRRRGG